jgi:hypothetical protein
MELSIITLGHVHTDEFEPLTPHFSRIEQLVTDLPPRAILIEKRPELNRAIDAASSDWILLLREREFVDAALAQEIAAEISGAPAPSPARAAEGGNAPQRAWGFRLRTVPLYAGKPLRIGKDSGEVRLFHRRHLLRRGELTVQGTVIHLRAPLYGHTFESSEEHRAYLQRHAVPHSSLRRLLLFLRNARTLDRTTLRYLWIEAGFDQG